MDLWARVAATTIAKYVRGEEVNVLRDHPLLALLQQRGRIDFNVGGTRVEKVIRMRQAPLVGYADGDTLTYSRRNRWQRAIFNHRGYYASDSFGKAELLANSGQEAIVSLMADKTSRLMEDVKENFAAQLFVDGYATGNEKGLIGLESAFGNAGAAANGFIGTPSDTYGELSTELGNKGGSWSTSGGNPTWPLGKGSAEYDYWSPLIVDYTDTAWAASTKTWPNTCVEATRFGLQYSMKNMTKTGKIDLVLLDRELYRQFLDNRDAMQQINVNRGQPAGLTALGFTDAVNFDGVDLLRGYGLPLSNSAPVGYGLNVDQMQLWSMQGQLFVSQVDEDRANKATNVDIDFLGNMWFNPRHQFTLRKVT